MRFNAESARTMRQRISARKSWPARLQRYGLEYWQASIAYARSQRKCNKPCTRDALGNTQDEAAAAQDQVETIVPRETDPPE